MRVDKREQVSRTFVNISVNEVVVFTSMFQLLAMLALLGRILDADWSENDALIGWELVYYRVSQNYPNILLRRPRGREKQFYISSL